MALVTKSSPEKKKVWFTELRKRHSVLPFFSVQCCVCLCALSVLSQAAGEMSPVSSLSIWFYLFFFNVQFIALGWVESVQAGSASFVRLVFVVFFLLLFWQLFPSTQPRSKTAQVLHVQKLPISNTEDENSVNFLQLES